MVYYYGSDREGICERNGQQSLERSDPSDGPDAIQLSIPIVHTSDIRGQAQRPGR